MRCKLQIIALTLILALAGGCKQRCFLTEDDFNRTTTTMIDGVELKPDLSHQPLTSMIDAPPNLNNLDRKVRFMSLAECIAIALEQGTVGQLGGRSNQSLARAGNNFSDAIRVLALNPAQSATNIEGSLARFDAQFISGMQWQTTDNPVGTPLQTFQSGGVNAVSQTDATFSSALVKQLPTGGTSAVIFNVPYQFTNLPARVNPSYRPSLQFAFEQPLLTGFGVEINQISDFHPGSQLLQGIQGATANRQLAVRGQNPGILITRLRFDQSRADFEASVNTMLVNVEAAYWNLYGAYWTLYSREQGLRFAFESFKITRGQFEAGRVSAADFYQARGQYELFRAQRLQAIEDALNRERDLRALLGLRMEDGSRLMPSDSPTLASYLPDWHAAQAEALSRRPELYIARQQVKISQMILMLAKNSLLPDLRFATTYDVNSIGNRFDGPNSADGREINSFRGLSDMNFNNWSAQLRLVVPIGFRTAHVQIRQAQIDLSQALETLKGNENNVTQTLTENYQLLSTSYEQIRANRAQREAFGEQLKVRQQEYIAGRINIDRLLEAQRFWADALSNEFGSIVKYNNALAGFEFAKGTIQQHDNVVISEGPVPECAQVRAVEHERQRTASLVLFERASPVAPSCFKPEPMPGKAPSLPSALSAVPPLKDAPMLPTAAVGNMAIPTPQESKIEELFPDAPAPLTQVPAKTTPPSNYAPSPNNAASPSNPFPLKIKGTPKQSSDFGTQRPE